MNKPVAALLVAVMATAAAFLTLPGMALANGDHIHPDAESTGIPLFMVTGLGGFAIIVVLFFLANWARYRRMQGRGDTPQGPETLQAQDEEEDDAP